jgi:hypothetical protein
MIKRPCSFRGKCLTLTEVDESLDLPQLGAYQTKWCDKHMKQYDKEQKILAKLVPKYNKMNIKDRFDRVIKFKCGTDVSNYLFRNNKRELNKILKKAN